MYTFDITFVLFCSIPTTIKMDLDFIALVQHNANVNLRSNMCVTLRYDCSQHLYLVENDFIFCVSTHVL